MSLHYCFKWNTVFNSCPLCGQFHREMTNIFPTVDEKFTFPQYRKTVFKTMFKEMRLH